MLILINGQSLDLEFSCQSNNRQEERLCGNLCRDKYYCDFVSTQFCTGPKNAADVLMKLVNDYQAAAKPTSRPQIGVVEGCGNRFYINNSLTVRVDYNVTKVEPGFNKALIEVWFHPFNGHFYTKSRAKINNKYPGAGHVHSIQADLKHFGHKFRNNSGIVYGIIWHSNHLPNETQGLFITKLCTQR